MKRRFIMLAAIYMALPAILLAQPKEQPPLVGLWELKIRQNGVAAPRVGLEIFGGDGNSCAVFRGRRAPS
jgi:hypothetical protein